ncbi:hypothetical protein OROGR_016151 [Orobanche gracilis]
MSRMSSVVTAVDYSASSSLHLQYPNHQDALWQMNMRSREQSESGPFPVREGEPDCSYYIRTGLCRFGMTCRFNHPPNRKLAIATARVKGEYPERTGQPECQYYLKTGTCKFGDEMECAYYMRIGLCKFGSICKFHLRGSSIYPSIHSPTASQLSFPLSRASFVASPRWQNPSSYAQMVMPNGMVSVRGWNTYSVMDSLQGQLSSVLSSENQHPATGNSQNDGTSQQDESGSLGSQFHSRSVPIGYYAFQRDHVFPERPGQPECQFYMKTGDCKFGAVCKFHHPRERHIPVPDCVLSQIGLPLRPGEPLCVFYSRYGICKFGPSCKFDHPMRVFAYNAAVASSSDSPSVGHFLASSSGNVALSFSADGLVEAGSTNRRLSLSEARQKSSGDDKSDSE